MVATIGFFVDYVQSVGTSMVAYTVTVCSPTSPRSSVYTEKSLDYSLCVINDGKERMVYCYS